MQALAIFLFVGGLHAHDTGHFFSLAKSIPEELGATQKNAVAEEPNSLSCKLNINLFDVASGQPVYGLIHITRQADEKALHLPELFERPMNWYSMPNQASVAVPQDELVVEAIHGLETEVARHIVDLRGQTQATLSIPLKRFFHPESRAIRSGNTHLHLILSARRKMGVVLRNRAEADRYLQLACRSDGLDLVYVSYLTRPGAYYISNEYTRDDLQGLSQGSIRFVNGEEHRHAGVERKDGSRFSYGHVMFLDLTELVQPVSIGPGLTEGGKDTDGLALRAGMETAIKAGAGVVWCHGTQGLESIPSWIMGLPHAQNIYDGGNKGTYSSVYYRLLNAGIKVPFSTGTDWGLWDFSRVYVPADADMTSKIFINRLAQGQSFITNGPILSLQAGDQVPGDTLKLQGPTKIRVRGTGIGRRNFRRLELIASLARLGGFDRVSNFFRSATH